MSTCRMCFAGRHIRCLDKTACGCPPCSLRRNRPVTVSHTRVPGRPNGNGAGRGGFQPGVGGGPNAGCPSKLTERQMEEMVELVAAGMSISEAARQFGVSWKVARRVVKGDPERGPYKKVRAA